MPLSHLGITLPGLYDTLPQYTNPTSASGQSQQSHYSTLNHDDPRSLGAGEIPSPRAAPGCAGICSAQGRRCNKCQGASAPSHSQYSGYSGDGAGLYNMDGSSTAPSGALQSLHATALRPSQYQQQQQPPPSMSPAPTPSSQSLFTADGFASGGTRPISNVTTSFDGAEPRTLQSGTGAPRSGHQQQPFPQQLSRGPSLFAYDVGQGRPLAAAPANPPGMPSLSHWSAKDQAAPPASSPPGSLPGAYPCIAYPSWGSMGAQQGAADGGGGSDSSSLRHSGSSSSSGNTSYQASIPRYPEYPNPSSSVPASSTSAYRLKNYLGGSATDVNMSVPDLASSSPWSSGSVHIRDSYSRPVSSNMEYHAPPQDLLYSQTQAQHYPQYLSPAQYGGPGHASNTNLGGGGISRTLAGDILNRGMGTSLSPGAAPQPWQNMPTFTSSPSTASPSSFQAQHTLSTYGGPGSASYQASMRQMPYGTDEARWEGVARRSHHADRYYLYGASTTHIYCRPSCASKRPTRDRVQFFPQPGAAAAAEAAGYRSCRRCKPDRLSGGDQTVAAVGECVRHMMLAGASSADGEGEPKKKTLKEYAARAGLSTFHFHRSLAKVMSITPGEYSKACQSLALQDKLGMDSVPAGTMRISSRQYDAALSGWSSRRAKRALGNIEPNAYASGTPPHAIVRTSVRGTEWGNISMVYSAPSAIGGNSSSARQTNVRASPDHLSPPSPDHPKSADPTSVSPPGSSHSHAHGQSTNSDRVLLAVLIAPDAEQRLATRFPGAQTGDVDAQDEVFALVSSLVRSGVREEQLPAETVPSIRRARLWAAVRLRLAASATGGNANSTRRSDSGPASGTALDEQMD